MGNRTPKIGSLLRIQSADGDSFVRVLPNLQIAVYDIRIPSGDAVPLEQVYRAPVLWKMTVARSALTSGRWPTVDVRALEPSLACATEYYIKDAFTGKFQIYRSSDGSIRPSTRDECRSLEAAAVWEAGHVLDRIRDHYLGVPNAWAEDVKATP